MPSCVRRFEDINTPARLCVQRIAQVYDTHTRLLHGSHFTDTILVENVSGTREDVLSSAAEELFRLLGAEPAQWRSITHYALSPYPNIDKTAPAAARVGFLLRALIADLNALTEALAALEDAWRIIRRPVNEVLGFQGGVPAHLIQPLKHYGFVVAKSGAICRDDDEKPCSRAFSTGSTFRERKILEDRERDVKAQREAHALREDRAKTQQDHAQLLDEWQSIQQQVDEILPASIAQGRAEINHVDEEIDRFTEALAETEDEIQQHLGEKNSWALTHRRQTFADAIARLTAYRQQISDTMEETMAELSLLRERREHLHNNIVEQLRTAEICEERLARPFATTTA
ncbi:MAG: hypothetical protein WCV84_04830 [Patescibacteria group bacterium]